MDYLYSLHDALVSINVPTDKAWAVVDAMERDMGTNLATKADLQQLRAGMGQEFVLVRKDLEVLESGLRKDLEVLESGIRKDMASLETGFHKDMQLLSVTMTVRLGSMLVVGLGVLFAALKLT